MDSHRLGRAAPQVAPAQSESPRYRYLLWIVLTASVLLRVALVLSGGQNYWPDEIRYERSRDLAQALWSADWVLVRRVVSLPDHALFTVLGLAPATLERLTGPCAKIPAMFFALFSVVSIFLVWKVMRVLGENQRVSLFAALLLALSSTYLYYSRHLFPYDAAMALGLGSLFVGLRRRARARDSALCGLLSACSFLAYNGAWLLAGFALLAHAVRTPRSPKTLARRTAAAGLGLALPFACLAVASGAEGGGFFRRLTAFSRTVSQGSYSEGWSLPFAYLWHAEHLLSVLWALCLIYAVRDLARGDRREAMVLGVAGIAVIYGGLVLMSVGLERMVVYGRLARQVVPFACILTALAIGQMWSASPRGRAAAFAVLFVAVAQAILNFYEPLTQVFPDEFRILAANVRSTGDRERRLLFAGHIYPAPGPVSSDSGPILLARRHPLQYLPYQYEGYGPNQRAALRAADIRMRLVLGPPTPAPGSRDGGQQ